jgi:hypothetical protein
MTKRMAVAPLAAFAIVAFYLLAESLGFRGVAAVEPATVSEAAALGHAARALQLIEQGQNANEPQRIAPGMLDSHEYTLRPLEAAIVGRHLELVRLLQRSGAAHFDLTRAICLAGARLPAALEDMNGSMPGAPDSPAEVASAIERCR